MQVKVREYTGHIWTEEENQVLKNYASNNSNSGHVSWTNISKFLPGLSARLCTAHNEIEKDVRPQTHIIITKYELL